MIYLGNKILKRSARFLFLALLITLLLTTVALAVEIPNPTPNFYINDYAGVVEEQVESSIETTAARLEELTKAQVVVVTMKDMGDYVLEELTLDLLREWGIGDAQENNGVLIFLDVDGNSRIEVGYGLEGALPDGKTGRIQDEYMLPHYREGEYSQGILNGFNAIVNEIYKEYGLEEEYIGSGPIIEEQPINEDSSNGNTSPLLIIIGLIIIIPLIILDFKFTGGVFTYMILRVIGRGGGGSGRGGGRSGGGGSGGGGGSSRGF